MTTHDELLARLDETNVKDAELAAAAIRSLTAQLEAAKQAVMEAVDAMRTCHDAMVAAERRVAELEKREIGLCGKILRLEDRLAEVERETIEKVLLALQDDSVLGNGEYDQGLMCGVEDRDYQKDGYSAMRYGYGRALERVDEAIRSLAPADHFAGGGKPIEQNAAATQEGSPSAPDGQVGSPFSAPVPSLPPAPSAATDPEQRSIISVAESQALELSESSDAGIAPRQSSAVPDTAAVTDLPIVNEHLFRDLKAHYEQREDALRLDAERYRWLRQQTCGAHANYWVAHGSIGFGLSCWNNEPLDAAIDEARRKAKP